MTDYIIESGSGPVKITLFTEEEEKKKEEEQANDMQEETKKRLAFFGLNSTN